jgi:hypothetical protein
MTYYASEKNGNSLKRTPKAPVKLTITTKEDLLILNRYGIAAMRRNRIYRLTNEAYKQGCLLTQKDLTSLMCSSLRTIKEDFYRLRENGLFVPTKGQSNDINGSTNVGNEIKGCFGA